MVKAAAIGPIEIEAHVRRAASEYGMEFREMMSWLARRDSLEVVVGILGLPDETGSYAIPVRVLRAVGDFLHHRGYTTPRATRPLGTPTSAAPENEEDDNVANLTKDEYLEMRAAGMGKSAIAKKIGASPSFVTDRLARWELKGDYQERMAIKAWRESHADPEEVVEREPDVEVVDTHVEESVPTPVSLPACPCVTLSIPITDNLPPMPSDVPTRIWRGTREDVMRFGLGWVQLAVNDAAEELRDILGVEDVTQQVQAYIERMLKG